MKVLICDAEDMLLTAIEFRLRKQGFEVIKVSDGWQTMEKIGFIKPEIIVIDMDMKKIGVYDLIKYVRLELQLNIPIIVTTELESPDSVLEVLRLGADDFIVKPFKPAELILRIKSILQNQNIALKIN